MSEPIANDIDASRRRRAAGQLACAECSRLRIRCDRKTPCAACIRRGCGSICPTGVSPTNKQRMILVTADDLDGKIHEMKARVRDLEAALQEAQSRTSRDIHPLLVPTEHAGVTLDSKAALFVSDSNEGAEIPAEASSASDKTDPEEFTSTDGLSHAFGTLSITTDRGSKWYGKTAEPEHFLDDEEHIQTTTIDSGLPPEILFLSICFPFVNFHGTADFVGDQLEHWLPPRTKAAELVDNYFGRLAAMFDVVPRDRFFKQTWQPLYESFGHITLDQLALMFVILACGCFVDSTPEPHNSEGDKFYQLARCAMAIKPSLNPPTVNDVQIQALLAYYIHLSTRTGREDAWISVGVAAKMSQDIILRATSLVYGEAMSYLCVDRDPAALQNLSNGDIELRRRLFWELYNLDTWLAVGFGRPTIIVDRYTDCQLPSHTEAEDDRGNLYAPYHHLRDDFCRKYSVALTEEIVSTNPSAAYQSVLEFDKSLRDDIHPSHLRAGAAPAHGFGLYDEGLMLQRYLSILGQQFLHRSYCCQAAIEMPLNPLKHRFGPSVLATYKSAMAIADATEDLESRPMWTRRLVPIYSIAFGAATTLGSLVIFAPRWIHAAKFLMYLDKVCRIFEGVELSQVRALLPTLQNLREEAQEAYNHLHAPNEQAFGLELALRLSGDKALLNRSKKCSPPLADLPSFQQAHPMLVGWLDEFGQPSGVVTPALVDSGFPRTANEESRQALLASLGLGMTR